MNPNEDKELAYYRAHDSDIDRVRQSVQHWTDTDLERMYSAFLKHHELEMAGCCLAELKRRHAGMWIERI